jgi:hypothetical protein
MRHGTKIYSAFLSWWTTSNRIRKEQRLFHEVFLSLSQPQELGLGKRREHFVKRCSLCILLDVVLHEKTTHCTDIKMPFKAFLGRKLRRYFWIAKTCAYVLNIVRGFLKIKQKSVLPVFCVLFPTYSDPARSRKCVRQQCKRHWS